MSRILKFTRSETEGAVRYGRDLLEEFPDEPEEPAQAPAEMPEIGIADLPFDPEELREEVMAAARADAEEKVKQAYREGHARGMDAGREQFDASVAESAGALKAAAEALQQSQERFLDGLEPQVISLVKLLVTRVIDVEIRTNPEVLRHTVRRALRQLAGQYAVTLYLHPDDVAAIEEHQVSLLKNVPGVETLHVTAGEGIEPGGCIARSDSMEVDARLQSLLEQVLDDLTE